MTTQLFQTCRTTEDFHPASLTLLPRFFFLEDEGVHTVRTPLFRTRCTTEDSLLHFAAFCCLCFPSCCLGHIGVRTVRALLFRMALAAKGSHLLYLLLLSRLLPPLAAIYFFLGSGEARPVRTPLFRTCCATLDVLSVSLFFVRRRCALTPSSSRGCDNIFWRQLTA